MVFEPDFRMSPGEHHRPALERTAVAAVGISPALADRVAGEASRRYAVRLRS